MQIPPTQGRKEGEEMSLDPEVIKEDGSLYSLGWYLEWDVGEKNATLDGMFTSQELRDIADHMDKITKGEK